MLRPVDYSLIYRLEDERLAREKAYVCPMWDWIKDFRDHFVADGWWDKVPSTPHNGHVVFSLGGESAELWTDEISGEIG